MKTVGREVPKRKANCKYPIKIRTINKAKEKNRQKNYYQPLYSYQKFDI